jgi:Gram-negative bacterial TonB protein C-terminal
MPRCCFGSGLPQSAALLFVLVLGCGRNDTRRGNTLAIGVDVRTDSAGTVLTIDPPPTARIWVARVAPVRPSAGSLDIAAPEATAESVIVEPPPPHLLIDDDLKPPIPKRAPVLTIPVRYARQARVISVELDVRVDTEGAVSDALWAGGNNEADLVQAATQCALTMTFYPALQGGKAVPVWCRQRFDFGGGGR